MKPTLTTKLNGAIRDVVDFPKPGIVFKDITPLLADGPLFQETIAYLTDRCRACGATKIVGIDARGFIFGAPVAANLEIGFIPVRKKGKLPHKTKALSYSLEYGDAEIEIHADAIAPGETVVMIDDLLATGGTAGAALKLIKNLGGEVAEALFLIELDFLNGRQKLGNSPVHSLLNY